MEYLAFLQPGSEFVFDSDTDYVSEDWNSVLVVQDITHTETPDFTEQENQPIRILQASDVGSNLQDVVGQVLCGTSPVDHLETARSSRFSEVAEGVEPSVDARERAANLDEEIEHTGVDEEIEHTHEVIANIVSELSGLTEVEIEILEETVAG